MRVNRIAIALAAMMTFPAGAALAQNQPVPCGQDSMMSQQDFTVGTWVVTNFADGPTKGQKSAEVSMTKTKNGCGIYEDWKSVRPTGDGVGLFSYSRITKKWHYHWIADNGSMTVFDGGLIAPNHMRYVTERPNADGTIRIRYWDLIRQPDGTVREWSQASDDLGLTWKTEYDLLWTKKS